MYLEFLKFKIYNLKKIHQRRNSKMQLILKIC